MWYILREVPVKNNTLLANRLWRSMLVVVAVAVVAGCPMGGGGGVARQPWASGEH